MLYPLDLHFLGLEKAIAAYLVETDDGLALHDCGPRRRCRGSRRR